MIGLWAGRYATARPDETHPDENSLQLPEIPIENGVVRVAEGGAGPYSQVVAVGRHTLFADEPEPIGTDTGPSPYDFLLAGLGACTSMTIRMYANRKKWALDQVSVELRHSRIHADDCASCDTSTAQLDHIDRTITLRGGLTANERIALLEIAEKCPVHRTLHAGVHVTTSLADTGPVLPVGRS